MKHAKDLPDAIQWHEGLLLAPQHFQQLARRHEELVAYHVLAGLPYGWGVRDIEFDSDLLGAGTVRVIQLQAIMPDGLAVSFLPGSAEDPPLELELAPYAEQLEAGELSIYLAVANGEDRFRSVAGRMVSDEHSEAEPIEIPRLRPKLQLMAGDAPSARYVSFPLAAVKRENGVFRLGRFVPPLLQIAMNSSLWQMCNALASRLREKSVFVAKHTAIPPAGVEDRLQFLEARDRLRCMVVLLPYYEAILGTEGIHPYPLYVALSSMCGPLSLLRPGAVPPPPVPYRHTDLHATFATLIGQIDTMLGAVSQTYRELKFGFENRAFLQLIDPGWLQKRLVIGVRGPSEREVLKWMEGALIGSDTVLGALREKRILGASRERIERADELGVASGAGITLFSIRIDPGFVLPGHMLMIFNPGEGAGDQRPSEIILYVKE